MSLYTVELRGIPVDLHQRATAAGDELRREFTLLATGPDPHGVPARLLALAEELSVRYADVGDPALDAVLDAAARECRDRRRRVPRAGGGRGCL